MTSIFEGQPPKRRPFPIKTRVIWVPGMCISMFILYENEENIFRWENVSNDECFFLEFTGRGHFFSLSNFLGNILPYTR